MRRWMFRLSAFVALLFLLMLAISWWMGGRLLAPANRTIAKPAHTSLALTSVSIECKSGKVAAWVAPVDGSQAVVVLAHPIRGSRLNMLSRAEILSEHGITTVLIDLQAHGETPGERITLGHRERDNIRAAVDYVRAEFPGQKIGVVGWSLGGAAALLASPMEIDALVLESVYPNIDQAIHNRLGMRLGAGRHVAAPFLIAQLKPRLGVSPAELRPIDSLAHIDCPVLLLGGSEDVHTTAEETKRMFEAAQEPKELCMFDGAKHVDLLAFDRDLYSNRVVSFLTRAFAKGTNFRTEHVGQDTGL